MEYNLKIDELDSFKKAILNCPDFTKQAVGRFLVQSMAVLNRILIRSPWKMGQSGGGVPVATRNLLETHLREINTWDLLIKPTAAYAGYVHGWDGKMFNVRGVQLRPWLDYTMENAQQDIEKLEGNLIDDITNSLAN